jgi:prophage DNA circulation protein
MALSDDFIQASFNGVEIFFDNSSRSGGRRIQNFEFSNKDQNSTVDHGRKTREISVNCYVIGDDWKIQRDRLQDELEKSDIGELVHPSKGIFKVRCTEYSIDEDMRDNGRVAIFSIKFIEAGASVSVTPRSDDLKLLAQSAANVIDLSKQEFAKNFSIDGQPGAFVESVAGSVRTIAGAVDNSVGLISGQGAQAAIAGRQIKNLINDTNKIMQFPSILADALADSIGLATGQDKKTSNSMISSAPYLDSKLTANTGNRVKERKNKQELNYLTRRVAIAEKSNITASDLEFDNIDEAFLAREEVVSQIDFELELIDNLELYNSMSDLKRYFISLVPGDSRNIPKLRDIKPQRTLPSLVVLFEKFGSIEKNEEFIRRNSLKDPCFVPGGKVYKVSDE